MTAESACKALREAGIALSPTDLRIERREERWLVWLPGERIAWFPASARGRVLVHGDLGLHNLAIDPATDAVRGIFDYDSAAWADRHHDARYLALAIPGEPVLEAALAIYEPAVGCTLDRNRIWLYNAVCAASFLASRVGVPAEQKWCGRTLAEDIGWVRHALDHVRI